MPPSIQSNFDVLRSYEARLGVQKETVPGLQMLQLSEPNESDLKHRATLKGVELPCAVLRDSKR